MGFAFRRGKKANEIMAHEFTEDQVDEFKDAFELFDRTGEGGVKWVECAPLARCFGFNPTDAKVRMLLCGSEEEEEQPTKADMEEKSINFEDFLPILWGVAPAKDPGSYEDFYEGLKVFDKDGQGSISSAELRHVMMNLGEKLTNDEVSYLLDGMEDLNGMVNYDVFIKKVMSDSENPDTE